MPLTYDFKETIRDRVQCDPKFRKELLREGLDAMLSGETALAKTILRDDIAEPQQRTAPSRSKNS